MPPTEIQIKALLGNAVRHHWRWYLIEGIVLCVLGLGAILVPAVAGVVTTLFLGWLFLIAGVVGMIASVNARRAPGFVWALLSALLALAIGGLLVWHPFQGLAALTVLLVGYFVLDGIFMIVLALEHRREMAGKWEWLLINGIVDLVLAAIVISGLPGTLVWVLGLLVGIDMIFGGIALAALALEARKAVKP